MATCSAEKKVGNKSRSKTHQGLCPLAGRVFIRGFESKRSIQIALTRCMCFLGHQNRRVGCTCFTMLIPVRRVRLNLVNWPEFLWTQHLENVTHVDDWSGILLRVVLHPCEEGSQFSLLPGWHTGSLRPLCPEVIPTLGSFERAHTFIARGWLQGDEHGPSTQGNRMSLLYGVFPLPGCHILNLWEQTWHWKVNLVSTLCTAKCRNKCSSINFTKWTYLSNRHSQQDTKHF